MLHCSSSYVWSRLLYRVKPKHWKLIDDPKLKRIGRKYRRGETKPNTSNKFTHGPEKMRAPKKKFHLYFFTLIRKLNILETNFHQFLSYRKYNETVSSQRKRKLKKENLRWIGNGYKWLGASLKLPRQHVCVRMSSYRSSRLSFHPQNICTMS